MTTQLEQAFTTLEELSARWPQIMDAVVALRAALAHSENNGGKTGWPPGLLQDDHSGFSRWLASKPDARQKVRESLEQPAQDAPVAWKDKTYGNLHHQDFGNSIPLYTRPQKREWQGLTFEDKKRVLDNDFGGSRADCMDAAEKILREKNT